MNKKRCKIFYFSAPKIEGDPGLLKALNDNLQNPLSESAKTEIREKGKGSFDYLTKLEHDQGGANVFCLNKCRVTNWPNLVDIETLLEMPIKDLDGKGLLEKAYFAIDNNGNMVVQHNYHVCKIDEFPKKICKILKKGWIFKPILTERNVNEKIERFSITVEDDEKTIFSPKKIPAKKVPALFEKIGNMFKNDLANNLSQFVNSGDAPRGTKKVEKIVFFKFEGKDVRYGEIKKWIDDNRDEMRIYQAIIWVRDPSNNKEVKIDLQKNKAVDIEVQTDNHDKYLKEGDIARNLKSCLLK